MPCEIWFLLGLGSVFLIGALVLHHFFKHSDSEGDERLKGFDRIFQFQDVFVCCMFQRPWRQRCSHECWIVVIFVVFLISYNHLQQECNH